MELLEKKEDKTAKEKIEDIKKKNASKLSYNLGYDSIGEGVEPLYFWILDFMKDTEPSGLGMDEVVKNQDEYEAAVGSGFFSDLGAKATRMQDQAMKMMATINTVVRSIINLIYDLREFDIRLETYEDLHSQNQDKREGAEISLRVVWMDQVDIKRGRGSINMLAAQLQFVTLRDSFLYAKDENDVDNLDLNDRVKRILKSRLNEYLKWRSYSEKELRKRYNIEKSYLKSQINSLKHYTSWVKPYLIAAKKLNMTNFLTKSGMQNPNIVNIFNNMELRLNLLSKKEFKPEDIRQDLVNLKLDKKYYSCIEVEIIFRTVPRSTQSQQGTVYVHGGKTEINMKAYSFSDKELEEIKKLQFEEDLELIEEMVDVSLKEIQEDVKKYLDNKPEEEEKEKVKFESPFKGLSDGFKQAITPLKYVKNVFKMAPDQENFDKIMKQSALKKAESLCYVLYDVYKKNHGMMTW